MRRARERWRNSALCAAIWALIRWREIIAAVEERLNRSVKEIEPAAAK